MTKQKTDCPTHPLGSGHPCEPMPGEPLRCVYGEHPMPAQRWQCSPSCIHEDARIPGHPERIRRASSEFAEAVGLSPAHGRVVDVEIGPMSRPMEGSIVFSGPIQRVELGPPYAAQIAVIPRADDDNTAAESDAYERGAEAMRAAVEKWAREYFGSIPPTLKAVLDGIS